MLQSAGFECHSLRCGELREPTCEMTPVVGVPQQHQKMGNTSEEHLQQLDAKVKQEFQPASFEIEPCSEVQPKVIENISDEGTKLPVAPPLNRRPSLKLEIPPKAVDLVLASTTASTSVSNKATARLPPTPGTGKRRSVQFQSNPTVGNQNSPLPPMASTPRQFSLARLLTPLSGRTSSLPTHFTDAEAKEVQEVLLAANTVTSTEKVMKRSKSGPLDTQKTKSLTRMNSGTILVKPTTPRPREAEVPAECEGSAAAPEEEEKGEEIPEEEAVCRICLDELGEGGKTLKMECSCKGELALAHEECAFKWFGLRGNRECDVCGKEVQNLPVTLVRLPNSGEQSSAVPRNEVLQLAQMDALQRIWHDIPVLVMISMLAYFCLLEQLLVKKRGPRALVVALPFSVIFGILTAVTATTLVDRRFVWCFSLLQLGFIILFAHLFYSWVGLTAVLAVPLAGFVGSGLSVTINALVLECLKCIRTRRGRRTTRNVEEPMQNQEHDIESAT